MHILLIALNAKYVHTNLALRYLQAGIRSTFPDVVLKEYSINDHLERLAGEIYEANPDVIGFSCYIWNISQTLELVRRLRPVCPNVRFVLGGPEVSFETEELLRSHPEIDAVVLGEAENSFPELLLAWQEGREPANAGGVAWRRGREIILNPPNPVSPDLNELALPYQENEDFSGQLVYVETSRGCPFSCQYCLSSTFKGVRYLQPEKFRQMFRRLLQQGARTVKFVDRTFNAYKLHAFKILDIAREESLSLGLIDQVRVHCEIAGDLLDEEWLAYLRNYPRGLIQLEIGVQSTHQPTLEIVSRRQNFDDWKKYIPLLKEAGIPLHLDLIAGLPEETLDRFRISFNDVYAVEPDMLQLGFLKVLKGSGLRLNSERYGLVFVPDPPYTILATQVLSHSEILLLQRMEEVLDKYYNSGKFKHSLNVALTLFDSAFDFYRQLAEYWEKCGWFRLKWSGKALFDNLWSFVEWYSPEADLASENETLFCQTFGDALRFDFYLWERPRVLPDYLGLGTGPQAVEPDEAERLQELIRRDPCWPELIPESAALDRRQWHRATAVAYFGTTLNTPGFEPGWFLFFYDHGKVRVFPYTQKV